MPPISAIDPCLEVNGEGVEYGELSCMYPALEGWYLE